MINGNTETVMTRPLWKLCDHDIGNCSLWLPFQEYFFMSANCEN